MRIVKEILTILFFIGLIILITIKINKDKEKKTIEAIAITQTAFIPAKYAHCHIYAPNYINRAKKLYINGVRDYIKQKYDDCYNKQIEAKKEIDLAIVLSLLRIELRGVHSKLKDFDDSFKKYAKKEDFKIVIDNIKDTSGKLDDIRKTVTDKDNAWRNVLSERDRLWREALANLEKNLDNLGSITDSNIKDIKDFLKKTRKGVKNEFGQLYKILEKAELLKFKPQISVLKEIDWLVLACRSVDEAREVGAEKFEKELFLKALDYLKLAEEYFKEADYENSKKNAILTIQEATKAKELTEEKLRKYQATPLGRTFLFWK